MEIITRVDEYFLRAKVPVPYPSVVIESKNIEALPILIEALELVISQLSLSMMVSTM